MNINYYIRLFLLIGLFSICLSCHKQKVILPDAIDTDMKEDSTAIKNTKKGLKRNYYFFPYKVYIEKPNYSVYDTIQLTVFKDTVQLLDKKLFVGSIENVLMRDLDQDQKPELYIVWYGTGSSGYGSVEVFEIDGADIDYSELGWIQKVFFTESKIIRQIFIEGDNGCCEELGMKFIYYELVDNRFEKIKEEEYRHPIN